MKLKIAVFGNTSFGNGQFVTAVLTLAGYTVNFCELPELEEAIMPIKNQGGIYLGGNPKELTSGKTGLPLPSSTSSTKSPISVPMVYET